MPESAKFEPKLLHPEHISPENGDEKPWLRQPHEPASSYMHFQIYKDLGPRRTLRKAIAIEKGLDIEALGKKKIQEITIPGSWSRASKIWNWKERAGAYDLKNLEEHSSLFNKIAGSLPFCSRAYRICNLHAIAVSLDDYIHKGGMPTNTFIALTARLQSVMHDIAAELEALNVESKYADETGLAQLIQSNRLAINGLKMEEWLKKSKVTYHNEFPE